VARVNVDALPGQQFDGELFIASSRRDTKYGIPATLDS
jgi:hypothetical protein